MRKFTDHIVIHCALTKPGMDVGAKEIRDWHMNERGWQDIGYHFVIRQDGRIETGRGLHEVGAHVKGHNDTSVGVCLVGGMSDIGAPVDNFLPAQMNSLDYLVQTLVRIYPAAKVLGHRDLAGDNRPCPCFDAQAWFAGNDLSMEGD